MPNDHETEGYNHDLRASFFNPALHESVTDDDINSQIERIITETLTGFGVMEGQFAVTVFGTQSLRCFTVTTHKPLDETQKQRIITTLQSNNYSAEKCG